MSTSNLVRSLPAVGARAQNLVTDEPGVDATIAAIHALTLDRADITPPTHSRHYFLMCLRGEKGLSIAMFDQCLQRIVRALGRETLRRVANLWFRRYGMELTDIAGSNEPVKTLDKEVLELNVANSRLTTRAIDGAGKNEVAQLVDALIDEARDVIQVAR